MLLRRLFKNPLREQAQQDGDPAGGGTPPPASDPNAGNTPPAAEPDFLSQFDADTRQFLENNGVKDANGLAKQFSDAQSYIGNSIRVPSAEAGEEDRKAFYEKLQKHAPDLIPRPDTGNEEAMNALWAQLGRPEDPSKYELPEGVNAEEIKDFVEKAHGANLTNTQAKALIESMAAETRAQQEEAQQRFEQDQQQLKNDWGMAYDQNAQTVQNLVKQTGAPDAIVEAAMKGELDSSVAKWLHGLAGKLGGEGTQITTNEGNNGMMTPNEATHQLDEIYNNPEHPYHNVSHPSHQTAVKRVVELMAYKSGRKPPEM